MSESTDAHEAEGAGAIETAAEQSNLWTQVTEDPLELQEHVDFVASPDCGAIATFIGRVRDHDGGRSVTQLHYSSHPQASDVLAEVAREFMATSGATKIAVSHRVGALSIGDDALIAAVSAPHRDAAFVVSELVEQVKLRLPIWKKQDFVEGDSEWVNSP